MFFHIFFTLSVVHLSRRSRTVRRRLLPVRHVRRVHGSLAGGVLQRRLGDPHVHRSVDSDAYLIHAHLLDHRTKIN